jgi:hypothetical protein
MPKEYLSPEERAERDAALDAALGGGKVDDNAVTRAETTLYHAESTGRYWARYVSRTLIRSGLRRLLNERAKAESVVLMPYAGNSVTTTTRLGIRRRTVDGVRSHQLALIQDMTWTELEDWLTMVEMQIAAGMVNRAKATRLLTLREQFPDTIGPGDACQRLGCTVDQFFESDGRAS